MLKIAPHHPVAAGILGRAMMLQNRTAEAIPVLEQAARRGNDSAVETQFADALVASGRRDEALAQLRLRFTWLMLTSFSSARASATSIWAIVSLKLKW